MPCSIEVKLHSDDPHSIFAENFPNLASFKPVRDLCSNQREIGMLEAALITVRTDNWRNFVEDFFLPNFVHDALKTNDLCLKIFLSLISIPFDLLTFPLRVITLIPRLIYNAIYTKETHPFYQYLLNKGVSPDRLQKDWVFLKLNQEDEEGRKVEDETFRFIQQPKGVAKAGSPRYMHFYPRTAAV